MGSAQEDPETVTAIVKRGAKLDESYLANKDKVAQAGNALDTQAKRHRLAQKALEAPIVPLRTVQCPIDVGSLRRFADAPENL